MVLGQCVLSVPQILMTFFRDKDLPTTVSSIHEYSQGDYGQRSSVYQINGIIIIVYVIQLINSLMNIVRRHIAQI